MPRASSRIDKQSRSQAYIKKHRTPRPQRSMVYALGKKSFYVTTKPFFKIITALIGVLCLFFVGIVMLFAVVQTSELQQNVVLVADTTDLQQGKIILLNFKHNGDIVVLGFRPEIQVPVLGGYGKYPLRSVYPLLQFEQKTNLAQASLSLGLLHVVNDIWVIPEQHPIFTFFSEADSGTSLQGIRKWQFYLSIITGSTQSLSWSERLVVVSRLIANRGSGQVTYTEMSELASLQETIFDADVWEQTQRCSVSVVNTTDQRGLALQVSNVLEQSSFRVVQVTNARGEAVETSQLISSEPCQEVAEAFLGIIPATSVEIDTSHQYRYRSDIVVFIGNDLLF